MYNGAGNKVDNLKRTNEEQEIEHDIIDSIFGIGVSLTKNIGVSFLHSEYRFKANNSYVFDNTNYTYEYSYLGSNNIIKIGYLHTDKVNLGVKYRTNKYPIV